MPSSMTCSLLELTEMEGMRHATLALTAKLSAEQASFRPASGGWSVAQVLDHLSLTLDLYASQFRRVFALADAGERPVLLLSLEEVDVGFPFVPKVVMPFLTAPLSMMNIFMPAQVRDAMLRTAFLPATNPKASEPRRRPLSEIRTGLKTSMDAYRKLLDEHADAPLTSMRVLHPLFGNNSIPDLVRVCAAHEERHQKQIAKIMAASGFPA